MPDAIIMGFAGSGEIDGVQVLMNSGNLERAKTRSFLEMLDTPANNESRSRVTFADGVTLVNYSMGFEVTVEFLAKLTTSDFLQRNKEFTFGIYDGDNQFDLVDCKYNSLSLTGSVNGLITCSISGMSSKDFNPSTTVKKAFIRDQVPLGYWETGNTDVKDWTLTINQDLTPMYLNEDSELPRYLKVALWDASLDVTTYNNIQTHNSIAISTSNFTINGNTGAEGYSFNGQSDLGTFTHRFDSGTVLETGLDSAIEIIAVT